MELERAQKIADEVIKRLSPYCQKIEVAGSIRRKKELVKDIDLVLIPADLWNLDHEIRGLGQYRAGGDKLKRISYKGIVQLDIYYASAETWATLFLIRTGSVGNNIRLATLAKKKGWHLAANGNGLFDETGRRIAGDTEESIYVALGVKYQEPWERN